MIVSAFLKSHTFFKKLFETLRATVSLKVGTKLEGKNPYPFQFLSIIKIKLFPNVV